MAENIKTKNTPFYKETIGIIKKVNIQQKLEGEVERLLNSGAIDMEEGCHRGILIGIALQNIAANYVRGEERHFDYKNIKKI